MLCLHNPNLESRNFVDGVDFTKNDPCIFVVYPAGAAGDLLISIIDKHYLRTGCEYYGINENGRVMIYSTDYEMIDIDIELQQPGTFEFNQQWFYNLSDKLAERNLNYSLLDQVIFGCHLHRTKDIMNILNTFSKAKVINIYPKDIAGNDIIISMKNLKLNNSNKNFNKFIDTDIVNHERVLNIPFGCLFHKDAYANYYNKILKFLNLPGQLISFEYIEYYLSKQHANIKNILINYSNNL